MTYGRAKLTAMREGGLTIREVAEETGLHPAYISLATGPRGAGSRRAGTRASQPAVTEARWSGRKPLPDNHPAVVEGRPKYPTKVGNYPNSPVLKPGAYSAKIGSKIIKGMWKGFPIYTLTLPERTTCPRSCLHWNSCYGNQMHWAHRFKPSFELRVRIHKELVELQTKYPQGFAVRLHSLGDFYCVTYVDFWRTMIHLFPALHIFGFTARCEFGEDPIADALADLSDDHFDRFAMRYSDADIANMKTVSIDTEADCPDHAIICPQQQGKTDACATCALCWQTNKTIAFLRH